MSLRAPDIKDEHGWQILYEDDEGKGYVAGHAPSRDKARAMAKEGFSVPVDIDVQPVAVNGEVLPPDDSPEAVRAKHAFDVHSKLREATLAMQVVWVAQATYLYEIYTDKLWEHLGFESFDSYLADPDTDIEQRWGYNLVAIYKQLVVDRGVDPARLELCQVSKVTEALPAIRREQVSIDEALSDVQTLTKSALKLKFSGRASPTRGKPDTSSTIHTENEPMWGVCEVCGSRAQIDPETGGWMK